MKLTYYNNTSDARYINKSIMQINQNPIHIEILENTSVAKPTFKMKDNDLYMTANYCWVDTLRRYYYIDNITLSNGYAYLECTCDVLMTYKGELAKRSPYVRRSENKYNLYQIDDKMKLYNYRAMQRVEFPGGFDKDVQEFVLCVIGNTNA